LEEFGIDSILKYGHPNRQIIRKYRDPRTACTISFEFGRLDSFTQRLWPRFHVQDKTGLELAVFSAAFINQHIFPLVLNIRDLESLLDFLVSDEEPTPWLASGPAARAAQVVALARQLDFGRDRVQSILKPRERMIVANLVGKTHSSQPLYEYFDHYIDQLWSDAADQSWHPN
jgi:hypothetical protein